LRNLGIPNRRNRTASGLVAGNRETRSAWTRLSNKFLPVMLDGIDPEAGLGVFDLDAAMSASVAYFSTYRCRLRYADVCGELAAGTGHRQDRIDRLIRALEFNESDRFDLCFFWDALNFLTLEELRFLGSALRPHVHAQTRVHTFGAFKATSFARLEYAIVSPDEILSRPARSYEIERFPHGAGGLTGAIDYLRVEHSALLDSQRVEILLACSGLKEEEDPPT
jgi:hypothetical protein